MSQTFSGSGDTRQGMTLVELMVVLAIIGLLASVLLPAVGRTRTKVQVQRAQLEMSQIVSAITDYHSYYGRYPISDQAAAAADALNEDATYGGVIEGTTTWISGPSTYLTNNCELMAVLLDLEYYGDGAPTINRGHIKNPRHGPFLNATMRSGTNALPGVGVDGMYRDPWGSPYIITLDLNEDGRTRDYFYRRPSVSEDPLERKHWLGGMVGTKVAQDFVCYEAPASVIAWSTGPDRHLSTYEKANAGWNRDNLLSWKR
jgi:prepilin-type N-terminal cleavage/methylation domain-containing protein